MRSKYFLHGVTLVLALVVATAAACSSSSGADESPATPLPPQGRSTGIERVGRAIAAIEAGDIDAFKELLVYRGEACVTAVEGLGGPPLCRPGEAAGTKVSVVPMASCEGYWVRSDELNTALRPLFSWPARLYGVYGDDQRIFDRTGDYQVIIEVTGQDVGPVGQNVVMTDDGVVGVNFGCGQNAEQFVEFSGFDEVIVEPPQVRTQ